MSYDEQQYGKLRPYTRSTRPGLQEQQPESDFRRFARTTLQVDRPVLFLWVTQYLAHRAARLQ